jgi:hypothetical protein
VIFVIRTVMIALVGNIHLAQQTHGGAAVGGFLLMVAIVAGFTIGYGGYASDHTRYFKSRVSGRRHRSLRPGDSRGRDRQRNPRIHPGIGLGGSRSHCSRKAGRCSLGVLARDIRPGPGARWTSTHDQPEGAIIAHEPEAASRGGLCPR